MFYALFLTAWLPHVEPVDLSALSEIDLLERAEMEFQEGKRLREAREQARPHFRNAAGYYDELRRRGVHNVRLYRNLGNSYLLADDLPHAILSYRQGLRGTPDDRALRERLDEARERVTRPETGDLGRPPHDARPPWLPRVPSGGLMFVALLCYVTGCVGLTRWRMLRRGSAFVAGMGFLTLSGTLAGWLTMRVIEEHERASHPLVVIARDDVLLRRGNSMVFPPRYDTPLRRGVEGRLLFERGDWIRIELSGGEIGWLPSDAVLVDTP